MKKAYADIRWVSAAEGGRKAPLQPGFMYYPHIFIDPAIDSQEWSVAFLVTPVGDDGISKISFWLLAEGGEAEAYFAKLSVGRQFAFTEGRKVVAKGIVTGIA